MGHVFIDTETCGLYPIVHREPILSNIYVISRYNLFRVIRPILIDEKRVKITSKSVGSGLMLGRKKMVERKKITVKFKTPQERGSIEMLSPENLSRLGIGVGEIDSITTSFAFPGYLYLEPNVATLGHLCAGSACATITAVNGSKFGIDEIFYHDENPRQKHYKGKPHWNHERRFITPKSTWLEKRVKDFHIIPDSEELEISLYEDDKPRGTKIIKKKPCTN